MSYGFGWRSRAARGRWSGLLRGLAVFLLAISAWPTAARADDDGVANEAATTAGVEESASDSAMEDREGSVDVGAVDVVARRPQAMGPVDLQRTPRRAVRGGSGGLSASELAALPQPVLRRTGTHEVLSPRRIEEATPISVEEVARRLPGVSSRLYSGDEHLRPSISVRGMPDNGFTEYTAVHVDGINWSTIAYGWTALSIFPFAPERIWAAEVHRGAHALRYGPNTIGGVVNFLTRPVPDGGFFDTRVTFGGHGYVAALTEAGNRSGPWSWLVQGVHKSGATFRQNSEFHVNEVALKVRRDLDCRTWIQVEGFHWRDVHELQSRLTWDQYRADRTQNFTLPEADWEGWAYGGTARMHREWGCGSWTEVYAHYRLARRMLDSLRPTSGPPFTSVRSADSDNITAEVGVEGEVALGGGRSHVLHYGMRYHYERCDRTTFEDPIGGGARNTTQDARTETDAIAVWLDDTMRWGCLTLTAGARLEWIPDSRATDKITGNSLDFDFVEVFPGVSLSYELSPQLALFGNWHRSFRAPQIWGYDFNNPDQELDFEHGTNVEVGLNGKNLLGCGCLSGSLALWHVDFSDFLDYDPLTDIYTNLGGFESQGVDLTLEADLGRCSRALCGWSAFGSMTRQESEFVDGENEGSSTTHVPEWTGNVGLRYEHRSGLYGVVEALHHGASWADAENTIRSPADWLVEVRAGWRKRWRVSCLTLEVDAAVTAKNALDEEVYLVHRDNQIVPGAGRELYGSLSLAIRF